MDTTPLLPQSALDKLILIGPAGFKPPTYTALQEFLLPYAGMIHLFWWTCLAMTMTVVMARHVAIPLLTGRRHTLPDAPRADGRQIYRIFRLGEIEQDPLLRWFGGTILLGFLLTFKYWQTQTITTVQGLSENNFGAEVAKT